MKCCNKDCDQGRNCPKKPHISGSLLNVAFTVVMLFITAIFAISISWWVITGVLMISEAIK
jgi:hypothetical protein